MAHYADTARVTKKIASKFVEDIESDEFQDDLEDALTSADNTIKNELNETAIPSTVPETIKEIAYLLSVSRYLDGLKMSGGERNEIAIAWEKQAMNMLKNYPKDENKAAESGQQYTRSNTSLHRPWQGSRTRGRRY